MLVYHVCRRGMESLIEFRELYFSYLSHKTFLTKWKHVNRREKYPTIS